MEVALFALWLIFICYLLFGFMILSRMNFIWDLVFDICNFNKETETK